MSNYDVRSIARGIGIIFTIIFLGYIKLNQLDFVSTFFDISIVKIVTFYSVITYCVVTGLWYVFEIFLWILRGGK